MNVFEAVKRMREMTNNNIPFSIEFIGCNTTKQYSSGLKVVNRCALRTGLSVDKSNKANSLISYVDLDTGENKSFYIPLLMKLNNIEIE